MGLIENITVWHVTLTSSRQSQVFVQHIHCPTLPLCMHFTCQRVLSSFEKTSRMSKVRYGKKSVALCLQMSFAYSLFFFFFFLCSEELFQ